MKNEITETVAVAMMPWVASIADLNPWITFLVGSISFVLIATKIIIMIRKEIRDTKENRKEKRRKE